jgi:hypothetical protein
LTSIARSVERGYAGAMDNILIRKLCLAFVAAVGVCLIGSQIVQALRGFPLDWFLVGAAVLMIAAATYRLIWRPPHA